MYLLHKTDRHFCLFFSVRVRECMHACVHACVRETETQRECMYTHGVCVYVCMHACVCERERERVCVCVCVNV